MIMVLQNAKYLGRSGKECLLAQVQQGLGEVSGLSLTVVYFDK